ncbi:MAG: homoserine kinase [Proteobacteria bacterium]|nr:homoserine kinase [Pseudomonadota bacterium]
MKNFRIFSPATIGNVASGFDVLGMAVDGLGDYFSFESADDYQITVEGRDAALVPLEYEFNTVTMAAECFYAAFGGPIYRFKVHLERFLPLAGGLGSSAASSVAGALAAAKFANALDRTDLILRAALAAESAVAGPHLDNIAPCYFGGLTLIQDIKTFKIYPIPMAAEFWITLVSPPLHLKTKEARKVLPKHLETARWTQQMAHCTSLALALTRGDMQHLAFGLEDPFAEAARGALIPNFTRAKAEALAAGAYGFSISGSGPTCFAFSPDEATALNVGRIVQGIYGAKSLVHIAKPRLTGAVIL